MGSAAHLEPPLPTMAELQNPKSWFADPAKAKSMAVFNTVIQELASLGNIDHMLTWVQLRGKNLWNAVELFKDSSVRLRDLVHSQFQCDNNIICCANKPPF